MADKTTRRSFLSQATAISAGALLPNPANAEDRPSPKPNNAPVTRRVLGANDRVNFAFIGMGGRMGAHTRYIAARQKEVGDVQAVAKGALRHRIAPNYAAQAADVNSEKLIGMLMDKLPADKKYVQPA